MPNVNKISDKNVPLQRNRVFNTKKKLYKQFKSNFIQMVFDRMKKKLSIFMAPDSSTELFYLQSWFNGCVDAVKIDNSEYISHMNNILFIEMIAAFI